MKANVGDHIVILSRTMHEPVREGEVLDVGPEGGPPLQIRWRDTGRVTELFPGPDARIVPEPRPAISEGTGIGALGAPARTPTGGPSLPSDEAVRLVRRHLDLEHIRSTVYDTEIWSRWQRLVAAAPADERNADVLDRLLEQLRSGG